MSEQKSLPRAVAKGRVRVGTVGIDCFVLDDGRRVLCERGIVRALTGGKENGELKSFLDGFGERFYGIGTELPIEFEIYGQHVLAGRSASFTIRLFDAFAESLFEMRSTAELRAIAHTARAIGRALSVVGAEALVDEVTRYDRVRGRDVLRERMKELA